MSAIVRLVLSRLRMSASNPSRAMVPVMILFLGLPGGMIAGTSAIKTEIEDGPNRGLTKMSPDLWVMQKGTTNVIVSSFIPRSVVDEINTIEGVRAAGVVRDYRTIYHGDLGREAIIYSYDPAIAEMRPEVVDGTAGVVIDASMAKGLGAEVGDAVTIAGEQLRLDGITTGTSAVGKEGVFLPEEVIDRMAPTKDYTAVLVAADDGTRLPSELYDRYSIYTHDEFLDLNSKYWEENASGLAIVLMQTAGLFGVIILIVSLVVMLSQSRRQLAMIRAIGGTASQVWSVEMLFLLLLAVASVLLQVPVAYLVVQAANASTPGFAGGLSPSDVGAGLLAVLMIAAVFGSIVTRRFVKRLQHPAAVLAATR